MDVATCVAAGDEVVTDPAALAARCVQIAAEACIARALRDNISPDASAYAAAAVACAGQQQSLIERMSKWALSWTKNILIFEGLVLLISPWILLWLFSGLLLAVVKCSVLLVNFFLIAVFAWVLVLLHWVKCIQAGASAVLRRLYACGSADAALRLALEQRLAAATSYRDWCKCEAALQQFLLEHPRCRECQRSARYRAAVSGTLEEHLTTVHSKLDAVLESRICGVGELDALLPLLVRNPVGLSNSECSIQTRSDLAAVEGKVVACLRSQAEALASQVADAPEAADSFLAWCRARQQVLGSTALCLSGGGSLAMYHMGFVRFLLEEGLCPKVISGVSGGSIVAAFLAIHTEQELLKDIFTEDISTRYPERWFPPLAAQILNFAKNGSLVPTEDFERTTLRYYGTTTFAEAYARTGRHVSISISSSFHNRLPGPVLLNHLTAPQVLIASAVGASCTAPGIMSPRGLLKKTAEGEIVSFDMLGEKFVDGSLTSEVPKNQLRSLFQVNQFIISQVNPHIAPFLRVESCLDKMHAYVGLGLQRRCRYLAKSGMLPTFFGKSIQAPVTHLSQYLGEHSGTDAVTLYPDSIGFLSIKHAVMNPTVAEMRQYLLDGQRMGWERAGAIRALLAVERALEHAAETAGGHVEPGAERGDGLRRRASAPQRGRAPRPKARAEAQC